MRQPSKLRYVECELPSEVEKTIAAFEDSFAESLKPFYDRIAAWVANDLPLITSELEAQIALREQLLTGSPVQSLASLAALDASTNLTSPKRDDTDPETIRIDERKLGAAGICLLNGRMFKIIPGDRVTALRHLWEVAGGEYDYFVRLGTSVYTTPLDNYTLFEYNPATPEKLPFVNKGFTYLTAVGLKNSQFKHRMVWTRGVSASYALKSKMAALGFTSEQMNNIFSGINPNADYDYIGTIEAINLLVRSITRLLFLPEADPLRQPLWQNEANYMELAIRRFLEYRTKKYTTSSVFDPAFWKLFLTELRPKDIKELLENRPEVTDIELPQEMDSLTAVVEKAVAVPAETTIINTYMNNLPVNKQDEINLTTSLFDLGLEIWQQMQRKSSSNSTTVTLPAAQMDATLPIKHGLKSTPFLSFKIKNPDGTETAPDVIPFVADSLQITLNTRVTETIAAIQGRTGTSLTAAYGADTILILSWAEISTSDALKRSKDSDRLEALLLELSGRTKLGSFYDPPILIDPADLSALFPTTNLPPIGSLVSIVKTDIQKRSIKANSSSKKSKKSESKSSQKDNLKAEKGSTTNNVPGGISQGFPGVETFAMLLTRRIDWKSNFMDCTGEGAVGTTTTPVVQAMNTVANFEQTESVESNEAWRQHNADLEYLKSRLPLTGSDTISDIRSAVNTYVVEEEANGIITRKDTQVSSLLSTINTDNDIKIVVRTAVELLKGIPTTTPARSAIAEQSAFFSELSGADRGAGLYAANNRNTVEQQGGKIQPPGLTSNEVKTGLETILGSPLPFLGSGNEVLIPFQASVAVELQFCQNKALAKLSNYGRQLEANRKQFEQWIIQFINIVKHQIIIFQDSIDKVIVTIQQAMDAVFATLERLLTIDLNFSGKLGFENSLFKCSWGIDLGLKINLLDLLLMYLDRFLGTILGPILVGLGIFGDFIAQIMCVPIRWLETILNGAAAAAGELLGLIGCTVKDFKLPTAVFELLNLINGTFSLRSLVLRKGSADWLTMMGRIQLGKNEFTGLSQFANACASPNLAAAISALQATAARIISSIPVTDAGDGITALQL